MADAPRVLVTPRSMTRAAHPAVDLLKSEGYEVVIGQPGKQPAEQDLLELIPGCVGYVAGVEPISARVIAAADRLVAISRNGVGTDSIDEEAARAAGIEVLAARGANAEGVAELTLGLILAMARSIPQSSSEMKRGEWARFVGFELAGATLGVVGCGAIGRRVSELALAVGMKVMGYDPYPLESFCPSGFLWAEMDDLLRASDVVTVHSPATASPIVNAAAVERMKDGVRLVNTARAGLVDAEAVLSALKSGKISGYAVDVYDVEPPVDRRLVDHPNVIATPHIGGYTKESIHRAGMGAVRNLLNALKEAGHG